jgi:hypothetical protein
MHLSFPIQIVWEDVFDEEASIPRKVKESRSRKIQDEAGHTWNLLATLYYKGPAASLGERCLRRASSRLAVSAVASIARSEANSSYERGANV